MPNTLTKEIRHTAIWGGGLARMTGQDGIWLAIPTGHMTANLQAGTGSSPASIILCATNADDIGGAIWQPLSQIIVRKCRIYYGEGGGTNTTHKIALMRYNIDADGDLTNGLATGTVATDSNSDDYTQLRSTDLAITTNNAVTTSQVLVAFVMCVDAVNLSVTAKCIIEYTN